MVEINEGFGKSEPSRLLLSESRQFVTNEEVAKLFGHNYQKLVEDKAEQLGIKEKLQFFDVPMPHNGSQAVYLAEQFRGNDLVLVPVLRRGMVTSRHHHEPPMGKEIYYHIAGESVVYLGTEASPLILNEQQSRIEIPLGVIHQVKAPEKPALTLIVMENARLVSPGRLHVKNTE